MIQAMLREDEHAYRERMEAFVSDLTGTTMVELVLVSIPIPMGIWLLGEAKVRFVRLFNIEIYCKVGQKRGLPFAQMRPLDWHATVLRITTGAASGTEEGIAHDELAFFRLGSARCSVSSGSLHGLATANGHSRLVHGHHK